ncbi:kinase-like domain-containing protein [Lipomyces kononenkoae]|uniref:Kinase-like domain-containing protein n=1 Tax=Lipomyces kononenkoae TaxID=34357 RepID=A0ACC3T8B4_LIPKO
MAPETDENGPKDYVPPSESPSAKSIPAKKRLHTTRTTSSIRQKLTRSLKGPLENVHHITAHHDKSALLSPPPPPLPTFSDNRQLDLPRRHVQPIDSASPTTSIPSPSKRKFALGRLAGFKDRAKAELSSTKSSPSSGTSEQHSPRVWIAESELAVLDGTDDAAEQEMKAIAARYRRTAELAREFSDYRRQESRPMPGITVAQAVRMEKLNAYEKEEILDFRTVYFCGTPTCCKVTSHADPSTNFGFDDDRGDYKIIVGDHLAYRYEIRGILGKGSFGQVVKCIDHKTGDSTAVKIIRNKKRFHTQALVETKILQNLREWDPEDMHHFVRVTHNFYFRGHLCIATELLSLNLYEFVKENEFKGLSLPIIRRFAKQLLSSLCLLQRKKVIHCDLKPENILLSTPESAEIRVIDFGSSCSEQERVFTYIQSRFYRSPEVILGLQYGLPIDMWSLGCILAELQLGYPIFPGENEQEQLGCIMEVFGPPGSHIVERASRKKLFFDSNGRPRVVVSSKGRRRIPNSKDLSQVLRTHDAAFIDFIASCLLWDPELRLKPDDAVRHPFITGMKMDMRSPVKSYRDSRIYRNANASASAASDAHAHGRVVGGRPLPELPKPRHYNSSPSQPSQLTTQVISVPYNSSQIRLSQGSSSTLSTPYHSARSTVTPNSRGSNNSMTSDVKSSSRPPQFQLSKRFVSSGAVHAIPTSASSKRLSMGANYVLSRGSTSSASSIPRIASSSRGTRIASEGLATPPSAAIYRSTGSPPATHAGAS